MPKSFQWITLLLIESIYFVGIRVKGPHTSVWIIPSNSIGPLGSTSKFQIYRTSGKHIQIQIHWTSRKHVQTLNHRTSRKHVQIQIHRTSGKHVQNFKSIKPMGSMSKIQDHDWNPHFVVTTGKHVLY